MNDTCLFCKIIKGEIPAYKVYEDSETMAFLDINPNNPGHTLVVPRDHFENIYSIPDEALCRLMISVRKIALAIKNGLDVDGINIAMNNERAAGQIIDHAHIHIIPRTEGDYETHGRHLKYKEGEAEEIVTKITSAF